MEKETGKIFNIEQTKNKETNKQNYSSLDPWLTAIWVAQ